jgi:Icc-related predicted phosphoesterase
MKLLLFSDVHCSIEAAKKLVAKAQEVDVVVGAGDFASSRHGIERALNVLRTITRPAVLVPGNNESKEELVAAVQGWPSAIVLHGTGSRIGDTNFYGLGGGIPVTPYGSWSYDFTEDEAEAMLSNCPTGAVLVSHSPPKGVLDLAASGQHLGSTTLRKAIELKQPPLVVCGHIHHSAGKIVQVGATRVVNAGPAGMIVEI